MSCSHPGCTSNAIKPDELPSYLRDFLEHPDNVRNCNRMRQHLHSLHQADTKEIEQTLHTLVEMVGGCSCSCKIEFLVEAGTVESCVRILRRTNSHPTSDPSYPLLSFYAASVLDGCFSCAPSCALPRIWDTGAPDELVKLARGVHSWVEERVALRALFCFSSDQRLLRRLAIKSGLVDTVINSLITSPIKVLYDVFFDPSKASPHHKTFFTDTFSNYLTDPPTGLNSLLDSCFLRAHALEFLVDFKDQTLALLNIMTRDSINLKSVDVNSILFYLKNFSRSCCVVPYNWSVLSISLSIFSRFLLTLNRSKQSHDVMLIVHQSGIIPHLASLIRCPATSLDSLRICNFLISSHPEISSTFKSLGVFSAAIDTLESLFTENLIDKPEPPIPSVFWALYSGCVVGEAALSLLFKVNPLECLNNFERHLFRYYQRSFSWWKLASKKQYLSKIAKWKDIAFDNEPELEQTSTSLAVASELRAKGNDLFRKGRYNDALHEYLYGFWKCPCPELDQRRMFLSNISECFLRLGNYPAAVSYASRGLFLGQGQLVEKCLFRRGKAYHRLGLGFSAFCDFLEAGNDHRFRDKVLKSVSDLMKDLDVKDTILNLYDIDEAKSNDLLSLIGKTLVQSPLLFSSMANPVTNTDNTKQVFKFVNVDEVIEVDELPAVKELNVMSKDDYVKNLEPFYQNFEDPLIHIIRQSINPLIDQLTSTPSEEEADFEEEIIVVSSEDSIGVRELDSETESDCNQLEMISDSGDEFCFTSDSKSDSSIEFFEDLCAGYSLIHQLARSNSVDIDWLDEQKMFPDVIPVKSIKLDGDYYEQIESNQKGLPGLSLLRVEGLDAIQEQLQWIK
ncbi:hypothetical protein P9112_001835 [Eukaryota sp. TZLM1-RC]